MGGPESVQPDVTAKKAQVASMVVRPAFLHSCRANPAERTWKGSLPQRRGHTTDQALRKDLAPSDAESSNLSHQVQVSTADPLLPQATLTETYLTDKNVCSFEVSSIHFGRFTRNRFYFDTDFLSFFCNIYLFMVYFNACYYSNVDKLNDNRNYNVSTITGARAGQLSSN